MCVRSRGLVNDDRTYFFDTTSESDYRKNKRPMTKSTDYRKKGSRLDSFMMGKIVGARDAGLNFCKIKALYNLPKSTVSSVVYQTVVRDEKETNSKKW